MASSDQQVFVPQPVNVVMQNMGDILDAYCNYEGEPIARLGSALRDVLVDESQYEEVISFLDGDLDGRFGEGSGDALLRHLIESCELLGGRQATIDGFVDLLEGLPDDDIVGYAEAMAGSREIAAEYAAAVAGAADLPGALARIGVAGLKSVADRTARTVFGRRSKLTQAEKVFSILEKKAADYRSAATLTGADGAPAENQALWCGAMRQAIKAWG